jgi:magnesium-transporting ATPase (P-type)
MIETTLCYIGFIAVYLFSGHVGRLGIPFLELISWPNLSPFITHENVERVAQTVFHAGVVTSQIGNAFACRTFKVRNVRQGWTSNPALLIGVLVEILFIFALIYIPSLAFIFDHATLPPYLWPGLFLYPLVLYTLEWIRKAFVRRFGRMQQIRSS